MQNPTLTQANLHCLGAFDQVSAPTAPAANPSAPTAPAANLRLLHLLRESNVNTPISAWASGCDGSPVALSTGLSSQQSRAIQSIRCGRSALAFWPFQLPLSASSADRPSLTVARTQFLAMATSTCRLCGLAVETPLHLITSCANDHMRNFQGWIRKDAIRLLKRMVFFLRKALKLQHATTKRPKPAAAAPVAMIPPVWEQSLKALLRALSDCIWDSEDGRTVVFRLMACVPWSAFDVRGHSQDTTGSDAPSRDARVSQRTARKDGVVPIPVPNPSLPLALALGKVFDATSCPRGSLRQWANLWTQWSARAIMRLAQCHSCALELPASIAKCPLCKCSGSDIAVQAAALHAMDDLHIDESSDESSDGESEDSSPEA